MPTPTLHFTLAEFHRRIARTRAAMQDRGIDTLIVSDPSNMNWLTGYDGWSFYVHQHGVITSLDPNVHPLLVEDRGNYINRLERMFRFADIIKLSDEDLVWLYPDMEMSAAFDHLISISSIGLRVLAKGADGARACSGAAEIEAPAHPLRSLVDTVGAGDTFMASMLAWLVDHDISDAHAIHDLSSEELEAMVERAAKAAALNCEKHGCNPPTREDLLS